MSLFSRLFPKAAQLERASKRIETLEADRAELTQNNEKLLENNSALDTAVQKQRSEIAEIKTKLRDQTDADLVLVSARIIMSTLNGNKPDHSDIAMQQLLVSQQQQAYGNAYPRGYGGIGNWQSAASNNLGLLRTLGLHYAG